MQGGELGLVSFNRQWFILNSEGQNRSYRHPDPGVHREKDLDLGLKAQVVINNAKARFFAWLSSQVQNDICIKVRNSYELTLRFFPPVAQFDNFTQPLL